jgi:hypothetical protein
MLPSDWSRREILEARVLKSNGFYSTLHPSTTAIPFSQSFLFLSEDGY